MAIEGQLEDVGLADICQLLSMGRKTGCLTVTDRSNFGYIYFEKGRVIYSTVLNRPDRLGELLVRNNTINRDQLSSAMEQQAHNTGTRLGQLLVRSGSITEEQLNRFITIQIEEAVYHLFAWERGSFHFDPDQRPEEEGLSLVSINAESLLLEGARRVDEWSQIAKKIPTTDLIFTLDRDPTSEGFALSSEQEKVLALLDGSRTVDTIVLESGLVEFDVVKAMYGLLQAGFIRVTGKGASVSEGEEGGAHAHRSLGNAFYRAGMLEDAEREYVAALEDEPGDGVSRVRLAIICLKGGRIEEALAQLDALPEESRRKRVPLQNRALALELLGRYDEARETLDLLGSMLPDDPMVRLAKGIVQFKSRDAEGALDHFRRYREGLARDETPAAPYYAFALLAAVAAGRPDEAIQMGREGLARYPGEGAILVNLGAVLEQRGETEAAEALFLRSLSESPVPPQAHKNLGDLAYRRGDQASARAHFERAIRIDPQIGDDAYLKLGNIAYKEGDRDWALHLWRRALELNPSNEVVRTNLDLMTSAPGR